MVEWFLQQLWKPLVVALGILCKIRTCSNRIIILTYKSTCRSCSPTLQITNFLCWPFQTLMISLKVWIQLWIAGQVVQSKEWNYLITSCVTVRLSRMAVAPSAKSTLKPLSYHANLTTICQATEMIKIISHQTKGNLMLILRLMKTLSEKNSSQVLMKYLMNRTVWVASVTREMGLTRLKIRGQ